MKKQQVMYIHGGESFANHADFIERLQTAPLWHLPKQGATENSKKWTGTFGEALGETYEVVLPPMPNKQNAKYEEWKIWFERHFEHLTDGAVLIGCSLGAMFFARYFSEGNTPFRPKAVVLMAGAYALPGFPDSDCKDFLIAPEAVRGVVGKADHIIIMHSTDDPVVPYEHGEALSRAIPEAEFITFTDRNHFLIAEFPELIEIIRKLA